MAYIKMERNTMIFGFDLRGFNQDGKTINRRYYDENGFDAKGIHLTGKKYIAGYDCFGYDSLGFNRDHLEPRRLLS